MVRRLNKATLYFVLGVLVLGSVVFHVRNTAAIIGELGMSEPEPRAPIIPGGKWMTVVAVEDEAKAAGIQEKDRLLTIDGIAPRGFADLAQLKARHKVGDQVEFVGERDGQRYTTTVTLRGDDDQIGLGYSIFRVAIYIFLPWFSLLLGVWSALARPRDPMAWLLLAMMLTFPLVISGPEVAGWSAGMREFGRFWQITGAFSWPLVMMMFGIYFPERLAFDRRFPWAKWVIGGPLVALMPITVSMAVLSLNHRQMLDPLVDFMAKSAPATTILTILCVTVFFFGLSSKRYSSKSPDAVRRLRVLLTGSMVSLTPLFLLLIYMITTKKPLRSLPEELVIFAVAFMPLFPMTFAYAIIVHRALDVRMVVRQGLQYALATRGILVLQVLISLGIMVYVALVLDPTMRRPQRITVVARGAVLIMVLQLMGKRVREWLDKKFFRESYRAEQVMSELGDKVRTMVEVKPLLETVAQTISETLHVPRVAAMLRENGHYTPAYALGYDIAGPGPIEAESAMARSLAQGKQPLRVYFDDEDSWIYRDLPAEDQGRLKQLDAQLLLPLSVKDRLLGFLALSPKKSDEPYSGSDVRLLESVALQTGLALENSRLTEAVATEVAKRERLNREIEIAREVQQRLFPQDLPSVEGVEYFGYCRPAQGVGGDYYDFVPLPDGRFGIAIGDVSGKGIPAALLMASLQACLRSQAINSPVDLGGLMGNLNRLIYDATPSNRYATFFYAQFDPKTRELVYCNGGHNAPIVLRGDEVLRLDEGGPVVGLFRPARYTQAALRLEVGDVLVGFTDGVSEAMNAADEEWGEDALTEVVRGNRGAESKQIIDRLMEGADAFANGAPQHDDMTLIVVKVV